MFISVTARILLLATYNKYFHYYRKLSELLIENSTLFLFTATKQRILAAVFKYFRSYSIIICQIHIP